MLYYMLYYMKLIKCIPKYQRIVILRKYHFLGICLVFTRSRQSIYLKYFKKKDLRLTHFCSAALSHISQLFLLDHDILELLSHVVFMQISPQSQNGYKTNKTGHGSPKIPLVSQWNVIRVQKSHYIFNARFPISTI